MAARTPGIQSRSEYHAYWGVYATDTALPNASGNPIGAPEYAKLENGDVAYVTGDGTRYVCQDPGTSGGGDAIWVAMQAGMATIRDAHVIVVGFSPSPANDGPSDADYLDPGDGTGLEAAINDAASRGFPLDIRIRPCNIIIDEDALSGSLPFTIPTGVRLIGAGPDSTRIEGPDASQTASSTQAIFDMSTQSELKDLKVVSPAPADTTGGAALGVIEANGDETTYRNCVFELNVDANGNFARTQLDMLRLNAKGNARVMECRFTGESEANVQGVGTPSRGLAVFDDGSGELQTIVYSCVSDGYDKAVFLAAHRVLIDECDIEAVFRCIEYLPTGDPNGDQGPQICNSRLALDGTLLGPGAEPRAVLISAQDFEPVPARVIIGNCQLRQVPGLPGVAESIGVLLETSGQPLPEDIVIDGNTFQGFTNDGGNSAGIQIDAGIRTLVVANQLRGQAFNDSGISTEAGHNQF